VHNTMGMTNRKEITNSLKSFNEEFVHGLGVGKSNFPHTLSTAIKDYQVGGPSSFPPLSVAICGTVKAGKSSLINTLLKVVEPVSENSRATRAIIAYKQSSNTNDHTNIRFFDTRGFLAEDTDNGSLLRDTCLLMKFEREERTWWVSRTGSLICKGGPHNNKILTAAHNVYPGYLKDGYIDWQHLPEYYLPSRPQKGEQQHPYFARVLNNVQSLHWSHLTASNVIGQSRKHQQTSNSRWKDPERSTNSLRNNFTEDDSDSSDDDDSGSDIECEFPSVAHDKIRQKNVLYLQLIDLNKKLLFLGSKQHEHCIQDNTGISCEKLLAMHLRILQAKQHLFQKKLAVLSQLRQLVP